MEHVTELRLKLTFKLVFKISHQWSDNDEPQVTPGCLFSWRLQKNLQNIKCNMDHQEVEETQTTLPRFPLPTTK